MWVIFAVLWVIVVVAGLMVWKFSKPRDKIGPMDTYIKPWGLVAAGVFTALFLLVTLMISFTQVDTGHVGIIRQFGRIDGQIGPGVTLVAPWKTVTPVNVQVQKQTFDNLTAFSSETQNVNITTTVNYSVAPQDAQSLIARVGTDWFDRLVPNNLNQAFKDETVKFTAVDIAPHREDIRTAVLAALRQRLSPYSIRINDLNIDNITFSQQFEQAIESKQEATQAALRAQAQVKQAEFEAQSVVAKAKGEADANVTRANGQAEANRKLAASLSPEVLQYIAIQKLAGNVQIALLPSGSGSLIDPTKLLQGGLTKP